LLAKGEACRGQVLGLDSHRSACDVRREAGASDDAPCAGSNARRSQISRCRPIPLLADAAPNGDGATVRL